MIRESPSSPVDQEVVDAIANIIARIHLIDASDFGPGNELVAVAVRTACEAIVSEEFQRVLAASAPAAERGPS